MATALQKITKRAKQLQKKSPRTPWKNHVKAASKEYRAGKLGATLIVERGETRRTKPKKVVQVIRTKKGTYKTAKKIGQAGDTYGNQFWVNTFAPRSRKWQNDTYRELKQQLKNGYNSPLESKARLMEQFRALEFILNKKPTVFKK